MKDRPTDPQPTPSSSDTIDCGQKQASGEEMALKGLT
jgi:hypothetical protein